MTLLEMLDVLEAGCTILQQRSDELVAELSQARHEVTSPADDATKRRRPVKRKGKAAKGRTSKATKKSKLAVPPESTARAVPGDVSKSEEGPKRGKRQALGMSFSKLRASIQARRAERRGEEELQSSEEQ